jgi:hypothetical protein
MKLISQWKNYWNKHSYKKYKKGTSVKAKIKIHNIPLIVTGKVEMVIIHSLFPICVKLDNAIIIDGHIYSYINITKKKHIMTIIHLLLYTFVLYIFISVMTLL